MASKIINVNEGELSSFSADGEFSVEVKDGKAIVRAHTPMFIHRGSASRSSGSSFDSFLKEEGIDLEVADRVEKRIQAEKKPKSKRKN